MLFMKKSQLRGSFILDIAEHEARMATIDLRLNKELENEEEMDSKEGNIEVSQG